MTFRPFLKNKRSSNNKEAILREIYYDNLRMAGKRIEDDRSIWKWFAHVKPLQTFAIMLVVALFPFSELDPSLYVREKLPFPAAPSVSEKTVAATSNSFHLPAVIEHIGSADSRSEGLLGEIPFWNSAEAADPGLKDYNLLLSGDDKVRLSSVFGLGVKTIVIDPGHGGRDPGAIGARGTMEKEITLDVALKLKARLVELGRYKVLLTRESDRTLSLADRVQFARNNQADLFISVHVNSFPNETINMIETYYFGAPLNSETILLAEQENKESHFSVGELDSIIQDFGNTLKRQESAKLAAAIQTSLFKNIRYQDARVRNFGVKMAPFVVLSQIEVPSVLVEISCITKVEEEEKMALSQYRSKVASYIEEGVVTYLETQNFKLLIGEK